MSDSIPDVSNDNLYLNFDGLATSGGGGSRKRWILIGAVAVLIVVLGVVLNSVNGPAIAAMEEFMLRWEKEPPIATMEEFMASLPPYSLQVAETNSSSPQAKALGWTMNYSQYPLYRLKQRYALAVLHYSTTSVSWDLRQSNERLWSSCGKHSRVSSLIYSHTGFYGSLPTELELLTDLEYMVFDNTMSGMIHSELCVSHCPTSLGSYSLLLTCPFDDFATAVNLQSCAAFGSSAIFMEQSQRKCKFR
jgi:hypothetical protein